MTDESERQQRQAWLDIWATVCELNLQKWDDNGKSIVIGLLHELAHRREAQERLDEVARRSTDPIEQWRNRLELSVYGFPMCDKCGNGFTNDERHFSGECVEHKEQAKESRGNMLGHQTMGESLCPAHLTRQRFQNWMIVQCSICQDGKGSFIEAEISAFIDEHAGCGKDVRPHGADGTCETGDCGLEPTASAKWFATLPDDSGEGIGDRFCDRCKQYPPFFSTLAEKEKWIEEHFYGWCCIQNERLQAMRMPEFWAGYAEGKKQCVKESETAEGEKPKCCPYTAFTNRGLKIQCDLMEGHGGYHTCDQGNAWDWKLPAGEAATSEDELPERYGIDLDSFKKAHEESEQARFAGMYRDDLFRQLRTHAISLGLAGEDNSDEEAFLMIKKSINTAVGVSGKPRDWKVGKEKSEYE